MKVFFSGSPRGKDVNTELFQKIYKEIESLGYENLDNEIVTLSRAEYNDLKDMSRDEQMKRYNKKVENIKKADICIFDTSSHSLSTGFLVNVALDQQKPTIVLYYDDLVPYFLSGIDNEKLVIHSYNEKNIRKVLSNLLEQARERRDKRFNFFISPKLLEFLESASNSEGITKSKYIRNLIVEHMRDHKDLAGE